MQVICPYCGLAARRVTGRALYPHLPELGAKRFWRCDPCDAHVGCHQPNKRLGYTGTEPLGRLANAELRRAKQAAHAAFDPLWQVDGHTRKGAYEWLSGQLGVELEACHIGMFDVAQCMRVVEVCRAGRQLVGA